MDDIYLDELKDVLGLSSLPSFFSQIYHEKLEKGTLFDEKFVSEEYLISRNKSLHLFGDRYFPLILKSAREVAQIPELVAYVNIMSQAYAADDYLDRLAEFVAPSGKFGRALDYVYLFAIIPIIDLECAEFAKHGIPDDVMKGTLDRYEWHIYIEQLKSGRPAFSEARFKWCLRYAHGQIMRIGELEYEIKRGQRPGVNVLKNKSTGEIAVICSGMYIHKSGMILGSKGFEGQISAPDRTLVGGEEKRAAAEKTGDEPLLSKPVESDAEIVGCRANASCLFDRTPERFSLDEWDVIFRSGDDYLSVHIPRSADISLPQRKKSYARAYGVFSACYDDFHPKMLICTSWMLDPALEKLLPESSNILSFQQDFVRYPIRSPGTEAEKFVFWGNYGSPEEYPEKTTLQRNLKRYVLDGGCIYAFGGVREFGSL